MKQVKAVAAATLGGILLIIVAAAVLRPYLPYLVALMFIAMLFDRLFRS